ALVGAAAREQGAAPAKATPFTIAVSREAGARGTLVAREVGSRLGWPVYDHEILAKIAQELTLHPRRQAAVDERRVSPVQGFVESCSPGPVVSAAGYVHRLRTTLRALGEQGNCVIVGRGAPHLLPPETTLRVRLVGDLPDRIAALGKDLGVSPEEAARQAEKL